MLIVGGNLFIGDGNEIAGGYIRTENGKIVEVGDGSPPKAQQGEQVVDAGGMLVTPGFVDPHTHLGMWESGMGFEGDDGNEDTDPCTPHLRAIDAVNPLDEGFEKALACGVTTVLTGPGSSNAIGGQFCAMKTKGRQVDKMIINPVVGIKFALGENPKTTFNAKSQAPVTRMAIAAIIREQLQHAKRYAEQLQAANDDHELDKPEFDAKCEALIPLLNGECLAYFHAHRADDIFTAMRIAQEFGLKYVLVHATEGHLVAEELAEQGARVIWGPMLCSPTKPELVNYTATAPAKLYGGVPLALCTDHPELPVQYLALSAALAVSQGMPRAEALRAITATAADLGGVADRVGRIAVGLDADLLIFDSDPLRIGTLPKHVIVDGQICSTKLHVF